MREIQRLQLMDHDPFATVTAQFQHQIILILPSHCLIRSDLDLDIIQAKFQLSYNTIQPEPLSIEQTPHSISISS